MGVETGSMIPDRFLTTLEYKAAFTRPAVLEVEATVLQTLTTEKIHSYEVSMSVRSDDVHHSSLAMCEAWARFAPLPGSKDTPSISPETICAVTSDRSLTSDACVVAIVLAGRQPGGVRLRVSRDKAHSFIETEKVWYLHPITSLTTALREFDALSAIDHMPLQEELLYGIASAVERDYSPVSPLPPALLESLGERLNFAQLEVIDAVCSTERRVKPRIVLVRGPPGSGKTMTLNSILNAIHVQQFNAYYDSLTAALKAGRFTNNERSWLDLAQVAKPRIIVCAPSNVAVDNVILRILSERFHDGGGNEYLPFLVRIGKGSQQHQEVAKVALSRIVEEQLSLSGEVVAKNITAFETSYGQLRHQVLIRVAQLYAILAGSPHVFKSGVETIVEQNQAGDFIPCWIDRNASTKSYQLPSPVAEDETPGLTVEEMPLWKKTLGELMHFVEQWEGVHWQLQRFRRIRSFLQESAGNTNSAAFYSEKADVERDLQTMLMNQAQVVCGTLNSCALPQVKNSNAFQTCVVDEAAQAVELSTLIPLRLGVKQLVLVGDPQQLPATVLAKREDVGNYERSLFERLEQCGVPVHTLNVQYRMHPIISEFPRNEFYHGVLQDSESVKNNTPFFSKPPYALSPFMFIDLHFGRDVVSQTSQSRSNPDEAAVCVSLYFALLRMALEAGTDLKGKVGIISPYAEQVKVLKSTFEAAGIKITGQLEDIEIATVDSFQGKEKDIIIVSTVRACPQANTVGFLADMRRMNVALTRAKSGLFVVGKTHALESNPVWADLIRHARSMRSGYLDIRGPGEDMYGLLASRFFAKS